MPTVLFLIFFFLFSFSLGLISSYFLEKEKVIETEKIFLNSIYGMGFLLIVVHLLAFFFPLNVILSPLFYFVIFGLAILFYTQFKITKTKQFFFIFLTYFLFSCYLFQSEIQLQTVASWGGNGDFFNHEKIIIYLQNFSISEDTQLNRIYQTAEDYVTTNYRYPIGAHILLNILLHPFQYVYPTTIFSSFHKIFLSYSLILAIILFSKKYKLKFLDYLIPITFFSLPLIHSVVGMDFVSQGASFPFLILFLYFFLVEFDIKKILFFTLCIGLTYYFSLVAIIPIIILFISKTFQSKKYVSLALFSALLIFLMIYFYPNIVNVKGEPDPGGLKTQFSITELTSLKSVEYNPAFKDDSQYQKFMENKMFLYTNIFVYLFIFAGFIFLPFIKEGENSIKTKKVIFVASIMQWIFLLLSKQFFPPYVVYKIFSIGVFVYLFLFIEIVYFYDNFFINKSYRYVLYFWLVFFSFNNLYINSFYHDNWLRRSNQKIYTSDTFKEASKQLVDGTLLIHRNVNFKSLLSLKSMTHDLYSDGFYFSTYQPIFREESATNFCDFSLTNFDVVKKIIIEEDGCVNGKENREFQFQNGFNGDIEIITP